MKKQSACQKINLLIIIMIIAFSSQAQQKYTQTVTADNKYCNNGCSIIDIPELNNNPLAIILATPVLVNGVNLNPQNIGAYYITYLKKWGIYNVNGANMAIGAQFNVEYYVNPDANHFVYVVPQLAHSNDEAYIDHAGLNNNPNAQIRVFPTTSPNGALYNIYDIRVVYIASASKWIIANNNNATMPSGVAYNVVFSNGGSAITNPNADKDLNKNIKTPISTSPNCNCIIPTSLPPNGSAGGDLGGTYPNPSVQSLQGKPVSSNQPTLGQVLKWGLTGWEPQTSQNAKPSVLYFNQSKNVVMRIQNVNVAMIDGLDNQVFTLVQSSRIVFHTAIAAESQISIKNAGTFVWMKVEILDSSNVLVGYSTCDILLPDYVLTSLNSTGIGILPAGTYHTRVSVNRQAGGLALTVFNAGQGYTWTAHDHQGGQMIIEIFPDQ